MSLGPKLKTMLTSMSGWRRHAMAMLFGVLATAALPPLNIVILLVPAFVGLIWLMDTEPDNRRAFIIGWWFGFGHFISGVYWIAISMMVKPEAFAWMIPIAVLGMPAILAFFPACAAFLARACTIRGVGRIFIFGAAWTVIEWTRSWLLTGFPWNLIATAWAPYDSMMQFSAAVGAYGLGLLTIIVAAMPAVLADKGHKIKNKTLPVVVAFAVLGLVWGGGYWRLEHANNDTVPGVRLRLIQPDIDQKIKWDPRFRQDHVNKQLRMSVAPPTNKNATQSLPPTHIIWAETAVPFSLVNEPELRNLISKYVPTNGLIITGAPRTTTGSEKPYRVWNSLHAINDAGQIVATYDKSHLVPFGEYVPFRWLLKFAKLTAGRGDFSPGTGIKTIKLPGLPPVSPLICYEVIFPGQVVDRQQRPAWMLNITNDGWYGRSSGPYQHFVAARMRALEEGLPLVRVANTGISAVIDAYGRSRASLGLGQEGFVDSALPVGLENPTLYGRYGNFMVLLMVLIACGFGFLLRENHQ